MKTQGNTVLITGGATGIGYALAEPHIKACDVTSESDRSESLEWVKTRFPEMNVLINNAGIQRDIDFTRGIEDLLDGESEIRTNLD